MLKEKTKNNVIKSTANAVGAGLVSARPQTENIINKPTANTVGGRRGPACTKEIINKLTANTVGADATFRPHFEEDAKKPPKTYSNLNSKAGITLIALIITIIVMLILVGVTISVALNGELFEKAETATRQTEEQAILEEMIGLIELTDDGKINPEAIISKMQEKYTVVYNKPNAEITGKTGTYDYIVSEDIIRIGKDDTVTLADILDLGYTTYYKLLVIDGGKFAELFGVDDLDEYVVTVDGLIALRFLDYDTSDNAKVQSTYDFINKTGDISWSVPPEGAYCLAFGIDVPSQGNIALEIHNKDNNPVYTEEEIQKLKEDAGDVKITLVKARNWKDIIDNNI